MKVFISWSGELSRQVAELLRAWLPAVLQNVQPYFSPDDVAKGTRWSLEIGKELEASSVGIICLTRQNLDAPWIMFEAGALSKALGSARVCPLLVDLEAAELAGPLVQFQAAKLDRVEVRKLLETINDALQDRAVAVSVLDTAFEMAWPSLQAGVDSAVASVAKGPAVVRTRQEMTSEILELTRDISRVVNGQSGRALVYTRPFDGFRYFSGNLASYHDFPTLFASRDAFVLMGRNYEEEFPLNNYDAAVDAYYSLVKRRGILEHVQASDA